MQKTLRIFRKDASHLWPEIALTLALTLGFALTEHYTWPTYTNSGFREARTLVIWMNVLMPIAWWLLIARAVHDESLVGDLQFWVTRPYGWQRILTAKLLFIAAFILAPFFLAQCYLLHQAGLHPLAVLPGLLLKLLILFAFLLLPLLALSTVTASLTRMLLVFFGLVIYLLVATYFARLLLPEGPPWTPGTGDVGWGWLVLLLPATAAVVTILQYARRRTALASGILVGLVIVCTGILIAATRIHGNINDFPLVTTNQPPPLQIALNADPALQTLDALDNPSAAGIVPPATTRLALPIVLSGIAANHAIVVDGMAATLHGPRTSVYTSNWLLSNGTYTTPEQIRLKLDLPSEQVYRNTVGKQLTIGLTYAVTEYEAETPTAITYSSGPIDIPQHGHCASKERFSLNCQYALKSPDLTLVTWQLQQTCGTPSPADLKQQQWIGENKPFLNPEFDPVALNISYATAASSKNRPFVHLCPGSTLTFTRYHLIGRHRIAVTLPPIDPKQYINKDILAGNVDTDE